MLEASVGGADTASQLTSGRGLADTLFSAFAEKAKGGNHGVAMKDGILRTVGLAGALAAGLLAASCGTEATGPRLAASRAALGSADPIGFNLISPNTAVAPTGTFAGDTIRTTGSGSFAVAAGTIVASGSFTHISATGSVVARGTWAATGFTRFVGFGGPNPGTQGGKLTFTATLFRAGRSPVAGVPVSVTCRVNAPSGFTEEEGTTVGDFTEKTDGMTLFHLD